MDPESEPSRITEISTAWTLLFQAHEGPQEQVREARRQILLRYSRPVHRYLLAATRDEHAADELYQEFALRLVRGDFQRAHPDRGRFREFLKTALYHLLVDYWRAQRRRPERLDEADSVLVAQPPAAEQLDAEFVDGWREELLTRAWECLAAEERRTGQPYYTVLQLRAAEPENTAAQLAERLSAQLAKQVNEAWVRKNLQRAREKFSSLLVANVAQGLNSASPDAIADELEEVGLLELCRPALDRLTRPA